MNRGIASGSGDGLRFGTSVISLWTKYGKLLLKRASNTKTFGILELGSAAVFLWSIQGVARAIASRLQCDDNKAAS